MDKYALLGGRLEHSFSADIHNKRFIEEGIDAEYFLIERDSLSDFKNFLENNKEILGFNVTIPFKEKVLPLLDAISPLAGKVGAVNTVRVDRSIPSGMALYGFNTDVFGFKESIRPLLPPLAGCALILGDGGAAKAVTTGFHELGIETIITSRHKKSTEGDFVNSRVLEYEEITEDLIRNIPVIVNATPLGMWPNIDSAPDFPYRALGPSHLCYDLVYNPERTLFMKKASLFGANVTNGLDMLKLQAEEAWNIWREKRMP